MKWVVLGLEFWVQVGLLPDSLLFCLTPASSLSDVVLANLPPPAILISPSCSSWATVCSPPSCRSSIQGFWSSAGCCELASSSSLVDTANVSYHRWHAWLATTTPPFSVLLFAARNRGFRVWVSIRGTLPSRCRPPSAPPSLVHAPPLQGFGIFRVQGK